ncbi:MAG: hypothetical protein V4736_10635 [Bdellovibrionota bacterium]
MNLAKYLTEVLGIKNFYGAYTPHEDIIADVTTPSASFTKTSAKPLQLWNEQGYGNLSQIPDRVSVLFIHSLKGESIFEPASLDMFRRMAVAMKLTDEDFQLWETSATFSEITKDLERREFNKILVWFEGDGKTKLPPLQFTAFTAATPVLLVKEPKRKKDVWDVLKEVMQIRERTNK